MKVFALAVALWCNIATAAPSEAGLHIELGRAELTESVGALLERNTDVGISARDANPDLHDMLLAASPEETVDSFVKRTCPGGNGNTCCPQGYYKVKIPLRNRR
jgi:hypothetical protein